MEPLLPLFVDLRGRAPRLRELHRQLRTAIVGGRLRPGLRLPSTRTLARLYGIGRNTCCRAKGTLWRNADPELAYQPHYQRPISAALQ